MDRSVAHTHGRSAVSRRRSAAPARGHSGLRVSQVRSIANWTREQPHDRFICPHADLPWHDEALALLRKAAAEPDRMLRVFLDARREQWAQQHLSAGRER